jgi:uncharacterized membrane protein YeaQ/YmgE (transglycosylase-associated protein family)
MTEKQLDKAIVRAAFALGIVYALAGIVIFLSAEPGDTTSISLGIVLTLVGAVVVFLIDRNVDRR